MMTDERQPHVAGARPYIWPGAASVTMDRALAKLGEAGYEKWVFGDRHDPVALAYVTWWVRHADVILLPREGHAVVYRAHIPRPARDFHPFIPARLAFTFYGNEEDAISQLLTLPRPGTVGAPAGAFYDPEARVPEAWYDAGAQAHHPKSREPGARPPR